MSAAMGILVSSFDKTLNAWINQVLRADVYIAASKGNTTSSDMFIPNEKWSRLSDNIKVEGMDLLRQISINYKGKKIWLAGTERNNRSERKLRLSWIEKPNQEKSFRRL